MPEHSPEPWTGYDKCPDMFFTADGIEYSLRTVRSKLHEDTWMWQEMRDIRRMVACVNACAGIPTEALEECPRTIVDLLREVEFASPGLYGDWDECPVCRDCRPGHKPDCALGRLLANACVGLRATDGKFDGTGSGCCGKETQA